jgi:hypothetical protein
MKIDRWRHLSWKHPLFKSSNDHWKFFFEILRSSFYEIVWSHGNVFVWSSRCWYATFVRVPFLGRWKVPCCHCFSFVITEASIVVYNVSSKWHFWLVFRCECTRTQKDLTAFWFEGAFQWQASAHTKFTCKRCDKTIGGTKESPLMEGIWSRTFGRVFGPALRTENPSFSLATRTQISNRAIPGMTP